MIQLCEDVKELTLREIAQRIQKAWVPVAPGAAPYHNAMFHLDCLQDTHQGTYGHTIVAYFLAAATGWRGEYAREIRGELNRRLRGI